MRLRIILSVLFGLVGASPGTAQSLYEAPDGCTALATLRLPGCLVRQVASCPNGNIVDGFQDGMFTGRSFYSHPALFLRFEGSTGRVVGHTYGAGVPDRDARLYPGSRYTYQRDVYRNEGLAEPGDNGTETLIVGQELSARIGEQTYPVLDLRFEVTADGYGYRERALMLRDPGLTIGVLGEILDGEGNTVTEFSTIPESMSLGGDPGFRSFDPAPSCLPSS